MNTDEYNHAFDFKSLKVTCHLEKQLGAGPICLTLPPLLYLYSLNTYNQGCNFTLQGRVRAEQLLNIEVVLFYNSLYLILLC